ncbi:4'-phosphopantetheinyl transferase superfamily protein [Flavobacterium paronense]|uniref:4'-phosphopantetheinyl transferase superfamily protein n=1 Tax=Flavobacterium paronense TaxID=1392775 RepID=A0ABV5GBT2_9FLAO|nr:4'-phosphopantetheinyl transferase superfamily protein [Flavobacterium paronense]MDN3677586.1 4'-phosphopantetheinyl transferase superfamily protein [Flavobacterium paronense]
MIGNDIIDLALAKKESNWKRRGFLDKLFTPNEQLYILNSDDPETAVWNLWSRKEACYKIYNRQTNIRGFIPLRLECFDIESKEGIIHGIVVCYDTTYYTQTTINSEFVETNALLHPIFFYKIKTLSSSEQLIKTNELPFYYDLINKILNPASKSHHGKFERIISF